MCVAFDLRMHEQVGEKHPLQFHFKDVSSDNEEHSIGSKAQKTLPLDPWIDREDVKMETIASVKKGVRERERDGIRSRCF